MKKTIILLVLSILFVIYMYLICIDMIPKNIVLIQGEKLNIKTLWGISLKETSTSNANVDSYQSQKLVPASENLNNSKLNEVSKINLNMNLFNNITLKNVTVNVIPKTKVIPLGNAIGLKLYTEGVLVVGMSEIEGKKPYENTGIEEGDRIISVDNIKLTSTDDLINTVNKSGGSEVKLKYIKENNEEKTVGIVPAKTKENEYKLGLWVRDAAAGVGTATFYDPESKKIASLGHGITDIDTGDLIKIANGELVTSNIVSIEKGEKGKPGELKGAIDGTSKIGIVLENNNLGVFGKVTNIRNLKINENEMEIASREEIKKDKAYIICELENGNKKKYEIKIEKIYKNNSKDNKSMLIKVTDKELLKKTGGIIQGMSGSPIIQNGKFVGAVTHVLVNDPTTGYGVFADMMLKEMLKVE